MARDIAIMTVQATDPTVTSTSTTHMDTASNISVSTRSRSRVDLAERMEVHMQMEAIRAEVRESLFQRNSLLSSAGAAADSAPSAVEQQKPWEVVEMLGKGATGEVFKCKWRGLTVAIKQINFQVIYIISFVYHAS